jgi:uncharacterized membrane protein
MYVYIQYVYCLELYLCKRREGRSSVVAGFVRLLFLDSLHMMAGKNYMSMYICMYIYIYVYYSELSLCNRRADPL